MATDLNYQKARRIRGTGFADLLSDQLLDSPTIRGAIKKTISLKTQARIKGIKEKFDPLNIAKFLTFGSSLGPTLLGRLTGRSEDDVRYFSGRLRPIRERGTASRIGKDPSMGGSEGVNDMLRKIYYLMQVTRESDLQRRDDEMNFEEERKLEAEKRHKELLKVLQNLRGEVTTTVAGDGTNRGMLRSFLDFLRRMPTVQIPPGTGTKIGRLLSAVRTFVLSPPVLAILGTAATAWVLKKLYENDTAEGEQTAASAGKTDTELAMEYGPGGPPRERPNVEEVARERKIENRMADFRLRFRNMRADDERKKIFLRDYIESQDPIDKEAATRLMAEIKTVPPKMTAADFQRMDKDTTPVPPPEPAPSTPAPVSVLETDLGSRLTAATNENVAANLPMAAAPIQSVVNNVTAPTTKTNAPKLVSLNQIPVRNTEPTFMRMIMDSTRVV